MKPKALAAGLALGALALAAAVAWVLRGGAEAPPPGAPATSASTGEAQQCRGMTLTPDPPRAGTSFLVSYDHGQPIDFVDLKVDGPTVPGVINTDLATKGRSRWSFRVSDVSVGDYDLEIWGGSPSRPLVHCRRRVLPQN